MTTPADCEALNGPSTRGSLPRSLRVEHDAQQGAGGWGRGFEREAVMVERFRRFLAAAGTSRSGSTAHRERFLAAWVGRRGSSSSCRSTTRYRGSASAGPAWNGGGWPASSLWWWTTAAPTARRSSWPPGHGAPGGGWARGSVRRHRPAEDRPAGPRPPGGVARRRRHPGPRGGGGPRRRGEPWRRGADSGPPGIHGPPRGCRQVGRGLGAGTISVPRRGRRRFA